ncbi:TetR family transcriptional regulator [Labrys miyagiensis]|uniref:TetR family transcriptional regulator n=1 Tax=Labrys miyagiensis TaxID=346912 RepID=A0ABQ6CJ80_9HYPH|nr:TetR family transcriptional regulator [Labrys miyagiensis]GLS20426.1 TetR family transcriptional regulator [Labrys miyagiensis]
MAIKPRYEPDEARERILDAAEILFRRIGYGKTTIADIANALGMSSANIYRFFPGKSSINDGLCRRMLAELHTFAESFVADSGPVSLRLEAMIVGVHLHNKARMTHERTVHEMVAAAMQENWQAVEEHIAYMGQLFGQLIAQGVASGEFAPCDVEASAKTLGFACCGAFHPTMIAEVKPDTTEDDVRRLARLLIRGLANAAAPVEPLDHVGDTA